MATQEMFDRAERQFDHPLKWPPIFERRPPWWQFTARRGERITERLFGPITEKGRAAFWREMRKGQSVYEDAGGYLIRCYRAAYGLPIDEPYTYAAAFRDRMKDFRLKT